MYRSLVITMKNDATVHNNSMQNGWQINKNYVQNLS